MLKATLKSLINKLWDRFWSGGIPNPPNATEQMTYLLFMKRIDDLNTQKVQDKNDEHIKNYTSIFEETIKLQGFDEPILKETLRWSSFGEMKDEKMLQHVRDKVSHLLEMS